MMHAVERAVIRDALPRPQGKSSMSDAVEGSNLVASAKMPVRFREDVQDAPLCEMKVAPRCCRDLGFVCSFRSRRRRVDMLR